MADKIRRLSPSSRVLRKDAPVLTKSAIPKSEQKCLDDEIQVRENSPKIQNLYFFCG